MKSISDSVEKLGLDSEEEAIRELSESEVKSAYRDIVKEVHPDQGGSSEEFKEVKEAYDILLDFVDSTGQSSYTNSSSQNTQTSNHRADPSKSSSTTSYTYQRRTKNQYKKDSYTSSQDSTQSKTNETTEDTSTDTVEESPENVYDEYYNGSFITTLLNKISYFTGSLNLILFFTLGILLSTGYIYFEEYIVYNIPYMGQITIEMLAMALTLSPLLIALDMRYNKLNSIKLFDELPVNVVKDISGIDSVISYSIWTKILLYITTFGGTTFVLAEYTHLLLSEIVVIQTIIILLYVVLRKQALTPSQVRIRREANK